MNRNRLSFTVKGRTLAEIDGKIHTELVAYFGYLPTEADGVQPWVADIRSRDIDTASAGNPNDLIITGYEADVSLEYT